MELNYEYAIFVFIVIAAILIVVIRALKSFFSGFFEAYRSVQPERPVMKKNVSAPSKKQPKTVVASPLPHEVITKPSTIFRNRSRDKDHDFYQGIKRAPAIATARSEGALERRR